MSYTYDDSGNLIDRTNTQNKHSRKVVWDDDNHMTTVIDQRDIITRFTYNADGERVRKKGAYGETIYINQFYSIRNNIVSSKHIFAGNTRIATRLTQVGERIREYYDDSTNLAEVLSSDQIRIDTTGNGNSYGNQNVGGYSSMDKGKSPKGQESQPGFDKKGNGKGNAYGKYKDNNGNAYGKYKEKETGQEKNADKGNKNNENTNREHTKLNENSNKPEDSEKERGKSAEKAQRDKEKANDEECHGNSGKGDCEKLHGRENRLNKVDNPNKPTDKGGPENANGNAHAYGYYKKLYGSSYYDDSWSDSPSSYSNFHGPTGGKSQGRGGGVFKGQETQLFYYHGDHLGSSSFTSDSAGLVHDRTLYFPFGETWIEEGGNEDKDLLGFKFTGKELDDETGYYYFGARYYEPQTARWISPDPALDEYFPSGKQVYFPEETFDSKNLKGAGGIYNSMNLNLYHYSSQNPVNYIDPDGRAMWKASIYGYAMYRIGITTPNYQSNTISGQALRFQLSSHLRGRFVGGEYQSGNAYRHALWQGLITKELGSGIAADAGAAHEGFKTSLPENLNNLSFEDADRSADLMNNEIGRELGKDRSVSDRQLAFKVLKYYKEQGLYEVKKNEDGSFGVQRRKLTNQEYKDAFNSLMRTDANGRTPGENGYVGD